MAMLSPLPFDGPVAGGRIARINGQFVLNPTFEQQEQSDLNIVFAASADALTMVEGEARFVPEEVIIDALEWGRQQIQPLVEAQLKLRELAGKPKMAFTPHADDPVLVARVKELALAAGLEEALRVPEKMARKDARKAVKEKVMRLAIYASKMVLGDYEPEAGHEVDAYVWLQGRIIDIDQGPQQ